VTLATRVGSYGVSLHSRTTESERMRLETRHCDEQSVFQGMADSTCMGQGSPECESNSSSLSLLPLLYYCLSYEEVFELYQRKLTVRQVQSGVGAGQVQSCKLQ
jgi:hypothetical protein